MGLGLSRGFDVARNVGLSELVTNPNKFDARVFLSTSWTTLRYFDCVVLPGYPNLKKLLQESVSEYQNSSSSATVDSRYS